MYQCCRALTFALTELFKLFWCSWARHPEDP